MTDKDTVRTNIEMPAELHAECSKTAGGNLNDWIRRTLAKAIGKPKLAELMRGRGRPKG